MVSDAVITRVLEYLRDHYDGYVDDLLNLDGVNQEVIGFLKPFVINISDNNRYHVRSLGKIYIKFVL